MSAQDIFDRAPIGAVVAWSDGTPRPPDRFNRKLSDWKKRNGRGTLVRKRPGMDLGPDMAIPHCFVLDEGDVGAAGIPARRIRPQFDVESTLEFVVLERPRIGAVRVLDRASDSAELLNLARDRADAQEWVTKHGCANAVLQEVVAGEDGTDRVEGRDP